MKNKNWDIRDLGLIDYQAAYTLQKQCVEDVLQGGAQKILLCEHPSVLTLGRLAQEGYILFPKDELARRGVEVHHIDRGGEVTLHSPGQLVVYPILDLRNYQKDLKEYLSKLEQVAIDFLKGFDIVADRNPGKTGVWVGDHKIMSVGVAVKKWVTFHGLALNINTDLNLFSLIKPCGLDVQMVSLEKLLGKKVEMVAVKEKFVQAFCLEFNRN
ncbi:MAG: lipoyl(octanoyl) transferase LipB [Candidatus Omnitrophica bacterium]|nr:lipoyl(octanoyl) transferase LipB [Candidatus Omnitrophota bacterium]